MLCVHNLHIDLINTSFQQIPIVFYRYCSILRSIFFLLVNEFQHKILRGLFEVIQIVLTLKHFFLNSFNSW